MHLSHIKALEDFKTKLTPEQRKENSLYLNAGEMVLVNIIQGRKPLG